MVRVRGVKILCEEGYAGADRRGQWAGQRGKGDGRGRIKKVRGVPNRRASGLPDVMQRTTDCRADTRVEWVLGY